MYLRPWISKHAWAKFNLGQLVKVHAQELRTPNQWGNHSHISNGTHRLPHIWPFVFTPNISPKPLFLPKIVTQSPSFFTLPRILEIFLSKTPNRLEFEKKVPKCPLFLWLLWLKDPYFLPCIHMVCLRGMLLPQTRSEAGKFCILETESCNLVNTFRCKFNKGDENKISVLQAQPTQLCIMDEFHWRAGMVYRLLSP